MGASQRFPFAMITEVGEATIYLGASAESSYVKETVERTLRETYPDYFWQATSAQRIDAGEGAFPDFRVTLMRFDVETGRRLVEEGTRIDLHNPYEFGGTLEETELRAADRAAMDAAIRVPKGRRGDVVAIPQGAGRTYGSGEEGVEGLREELRAQAEYILDRSVRSVKWDGWGSPRRPSDVTFRDLFVPSDKAVRGGGVAWTHRVEAPEGGWFREDPPGEWSLAPAAELEEVLMEGERRVVEREEEHRREMRRAFRM